MQAANANTEQKDARILIADDHDVTRRGLRRLLESYPSWTICAECKNGPEAVILAETLRPDVAVLDFAMPGLNGIDAARHIQKEAPSTEVLLLSMHYTDQLVEEIRAAGIQGYIVKDDSEADLVSAIESLIQHKPYFTPRAMKVLVDGLVEPESGSGGMPNERMLKGLTPRERQIAQMLAEGNSNREIGEQLNITVRTVETHRANIMRKLNIDTFSELIRYTLRNRIIEL